MHLETATLVPALGLQTCDVWPSDTHRECRAQSIGLIYKQAKSVRVADTRGESAQETGPTKSLLHRSGTETIFNGIKSG